MSSREAYLSKYLSTSDYADAPAKKKKKKTKTLDGAPSGWKQLVKGGLRIIDEDMDWREVAAAANRDTEGGESKAGYVDMRGKSRRQDDDEEEDGRVRFLQVERNDGSGWAPVEAPTTAPSTTAAASSTNADRDMSPPRRRHDSPDSSPPRRRPRHDSPDNSPPRRRRHDSPDASPPRRQRHDSPDNSPPRRRRHDSPDASPPRRPRAAAEAAEDSSPPRRRQRYDSPDASPPSRPAAADAVRVAAPASPSRDASPPRRRRRHDSSSPPPPPSSAAASAAAGGDSSPPRRKRRHDSPSPSRPRSRSHSPPRGRSRRHDSPSSDASPPRRRARLDSPDNSPPRRRAAREGSAEEASQAAASTAAASSSSSASQKKGLILASEFKERNAAAQQRAQEELERISALAGSNQTVIRDKSGRRMTQEEYEAQQEAERKAREAKPMEWASGLAQQAAAARRAQEMAAEAAAPFARTADDAALNAEQAAADRWGDPMLMAIRKRKEAEAAAEVERLRKQQEKMVRKEQKKMKKEIKKEKKELRREKKKLLRTLQQGQGKTEEGDETTAVSSAETDRLVSELLADREAALKAKKRALQQQKEEFESKVALDLAKGGSGIVLPHAKLHASSSSGGPVVREPRPLYRGDPWPNRFGIRPGYRWDGVVRGIGWEDRIVQAETQRRVNKEVGWKMGSADM